MKEELVTRKTVHFSGHVQGVGFRYSVLQIAKGFEVTGLVENLADGRVRLVAEGHRREVSEFVAEIEERLSGYIRTVEANDEPAPDQSFIGFTIQ